MARIWRKTVQLARMIKIEHSIFALPFAYLGMLWAAGGWPGWKVFVPLTVAMVAIRSFAMAVNRLVDLPFDAKNPRTLARPLVTGEVTVFETRIFIAVCAAIFVTSCAFLNFLCLALSPLALIWSGLYSFTKRFSPLCHFFLGSVLGLAPLAGWFAVSPAAALAPFVLGLGVSFWVAGFDILYACQDMSFDQREGLHSLPVKEGIATALAISTFSHVVATILFLVSGVSAGAGWMYAIFCLCVGGILLFEHRLISEHDLSRVNLAFFTLNGFVAVLLFGGAVMDTAFR